MVDFRSGHGLIFMTVPTHTMQEQPGFDDDLDFLRGHVDVAVLENGAARVAVVPAYQGRVMTSTAGRSGAPSFGWINRPVIASGVHHPHINVYGGEDRFWLGPEGGQYSIYFPPGAPFEFEHWQTPALIDTEPFAVTRRTSTEIAFEREARLVNYSGFAFDLGIRRTVRMLDADTLNAIPADMKRADLGLVAFESENMIINLGAHSWRHDTGLLSIWILGMYPPSPRATIILPCRSEVGSELAPPINDRYFGKVPAERLSFSQGAYFFKGDGAHRAKVGLSPAEAAPCIGSYDADHQVLTLVEYNLPEGNSVYVNSMWEHQEQPYVGDVVNAYNDGPPTPGQPPLGPFYELETSSPAAALAPGESLTHIHRTIHVSGNDAALLAIARHALGVEFPSI